MNYIKSWGIVPLGAAILLVAALFIISGCASVTVNKTMITVVNPMCQATCASSTVAANMNSGTSVETAIDAALKAALK